MIFREFLYYKIFFFLQELESRLANESSRASKLENDIRITENRMQKAEADANYFNSLQKEQTSRLQESESMLSKTREELLNLKNLRQSRHPTFDGVMTESASKTVSDGGDQMHLESIVKVNHDGIIQTKCSDTLRIADKDFKDNILDKQSAELFQIGNGKSVPFDHNQKVTSSLRHDANNLPVPIINNHKVTQKQSYSTNSDRQEYSTKFRKTDNEHDFSADITTLDRITLEKQYSAIRLHRNALIREKSFLLSKLKQNGQDLVFLKTVLQNVILEAEHKIGMLQATIFNCGIDTEDNECDTVSNRQTLVNSADINQEITPTKSKPSSEECPLSPFATEYVPAASLVQVQNNSQFVTATPLSGNYYGLIPQVDAAYLFQQVVSGSYPCYSAPTQVPFVDYGLNAPNFRKR